ncbi:MAG: Fimbrial protein [Stenotrophomonas maltophilia]|uniref:Fimbrial protein n=1 Tax=Stenotrophomonas maltophilia TaxID=40324 RepID=A0A7V8JLN9_STEMA|nr:MAG: Fimbrial protein [Stenotrophomonas maltophilia]
MLVVLVAVAGLLAAIAMPAYHDYTTRSKVTGAVAALVPLKLQVEEFAEQNGRCPSANDAGFPAAHAFAGDGLSSVNIGRFEVGTCGIEASLSVPGQPIDGDLLWLEYDRDSGRWQCGGESPDKVLPTPCQG